MRMPRVILKLSRQLVRKGNLPRHQNDLTMMRNLLEYFGNFVNKYNFDKSRLQNIVTTVETIAGVKVDSFQPESNTSKKPCKRFHAHVNVYRHPLLKTCSTCLFDTNVIECNKYYPSTGTHVIYCHGGGFSMLSPNVYKAMLQNLSFLSGAKVYAPYYRKSPLSTWPLAIADISNVYTYMLNQMGVPSEQIVLAGDSAGANIAISTYFKNCIHNTNPKPSKIALLSPWVDLTCRGLSYELLKNADPILDKEYLLRLAWIYIRGNFAVNTFDESVQTRLQEVCMDKGMPYLYKGENDLFRKKAENPLISPIYASPKYFADFPRTMILASTSELMLSDALKLTSLINNKEPIRLHDYVFEKNSDGVFTNEEKLVNDMSKIQSSIYLHNQPSNPACLKVFPNSLHCFPNFLKLDPSGVSSLETISQFIQNSIP